MRNIKISAMQPIGNAASELAKIAVVPHAEALELLQTANNEGFAVSPDSNIAVHIGRDDIAFQVAIG